jgi:hypothetical protein
MWMFENKNEKVREFGAYQFVDGISSQRFALDVDSIIAQVV